MKITRDTIFNFVLILLALFLLSSFVNAALVMTKVELVCFDLGYEFSDVAHTGYFNNKNVRGYCYNHTDKVPITLD